VGATAIVARSIGARRIRVANRVAGTERDGGARGRFSWSPWCCSPGAGKWFGHPACVGLAADFATIYLRIIA